MTMTMISIILESIIIFGILFLVIRLQSRVTKLESLALDTYSDHHEHVLLANRDKNCCEDVSSKTSSVKNSKKITQDRLVHGPCTRTEAIHPNIRTETKG